ncbi:uncharacterized protein LOC133909792 [Phragmites australis]|uniref:uncharacterized protein LOC133909792 n=1 Tax=Phragmites australis TaxID=29695 RepID=UPI002D78D378|nr:uncharacterized protein LOC133909792 [Phragmites australis]
MAAGRLYKPKMKSFWILVRRLLLRKNHKPPPAAAEGDAEEEKSGLLGRSRLEQLLLVTDDGAPGDTAAVCRCAKNHDQPVAVLLPALARPEAAAVSMTGGGGRNGAAVHRRFMFGGFRRRLLMRRPWRPMLVAIPE